MKYQTPTEAAASQARQASGAAEISFRRYQKALY
jgi:hypothetical protein